MRCVDDTGKVGLAFFKRPQDYFFRLYKYYKLPRKYTVSGEILKITHSFYVPIPAILMPDAGVSKKSPDKFVQVRDGFLQDGTNVLLVTKTRTMSLRGKEKVFLGLQWLRNSLSFLRFSPFSGTIKRLIY